MTAVMGVMVSKAAYRINNTEESKLEKTKSSRDHKRKQRALLERALAAAETHGKLIVNRSFLKARAIS